MRTMPQFEPTDGYQFAGSGMDSGGGSIPIATPTTLGGIKLGETISSDANGVANVSIAISSNEFDTGMKWVDGKTIFGKKYTVASMPTEYTKIDDLNGRTLIYSFGTLSYSNKRWQFPLFYNQSIYAMICTTDTEIQVRGTQYTTNLEVVILYTKGE